MDIGMLLHFAEAIRAIYDHEFEPSEDSFTECTFDQYESLERQGYDRTRRWFVVTGRWFEQVSRSSEELLLVDESERQSLLAAAAWTTKVTDASGGPFASFQERLQFLTSRLPDVLWKPTAPERQRPRLRLVPDQPGG
jgi:hypothetical protein